MKTNSKVRSALIAGGMFVVGASSAADSNNDTLMATFATAKGSQVLEYQVLQNLKVFEGDIILGEPIDGGQSMETARLRGLYKWSGGRIPYTISNPSLRVPVEAAIALWEQSESIKFVPVAAGDDDFIAFKVGSHCASNVGRQGGEQTVLIAPSCSADQITHQIGHALGLWHGDALSRGNREPSNTSLMSIERGVSVGNPNKADRPNNPPQRDIVIGNIPPGDVTGPPFDLSEYFCRLRKANGIGVGSDVNGDGHSDLVTGVPDETIGGVNQTGIVSVSFGTPTGLTSADNRVLHRDLPSAVGVNNANDHFGYSVAVGDFNDDCYDDIAVGAYQDDVGGVVDAGSVYVYHGSANGPSLNDDQEFTLSSFGEPTSRRVDAEFGTALTAADFDGDGFDDLAIGAPQSNQAGVPFSGVVGVLFGTNGGLSTAGRLLLTQGGTLLDNPEPHDHFGEVLAAGDFDSDGNDDLIVGIPQEDVGSRNNLGAVAVIPGSAAGLTGAGDLFLSQNSDFIPNAPIAEENFGAALAVGDFDGDSFPDLAIGVPYQNDTVAKPNTGAVNVLYGAPAGLSLFSAEIWEQNSNGLQGKREKQDWFGAALTAGDINADGYDDLFVGVPGEAYNNSSGVSVEGGMVHMIPGSAFGLTGSGDFMLTQESSSIQGTGEDVDRFGSALSMSDITGDGIPDLIVGVFAEDLNRGGSVRAGAGGINVIPGSTAGFDTSIDQFWSQDIPGMVDQSESGDHFGWSIP